MGLKLTATTCVDKLTARMRPTALAAYHWKWLKSGVTVDESARPTRLTPWQTAGYFLYGQVLRAGDVVRENPPQIPPALMPLEAAAAVGHSSSGSGERRSTLDTLAAQAAVNLAAAGSEHGGPSANIASNIVRLVSVRPLEWYTKQAVIREYQRQYNVRLSEEAYQGAIDLLLREKRVEQNATSGDVRAYNQTARIREALTNFSARGVISSLPEIIRAAHEDAQGLFRNVDVYLIDGATHEARKVAGREESIYADWKAVASGSLFSTPLSRGGKKTEHFRDVKRAVSVFATEAIERYVGQFEEVGEALVCRIKINARGDEIAFKFTDWRPKGEPGCNPSLYSRATGTDQREVNIAIEEFVGSVARAVGACLTEGTGLKEQWSEEARLQTVPPASVMPNEQFKDLVPILRWYDGWLARLRLKRGFTRIERDSRRERCFQEFTIEDPRRIKDPKKQRVLDAIMAIWSGFARDFMRQVVDRCTRLSIIVERRGKSIVPVAFNIVTVREDNAGIYWEFSGSHKDAQKLGFATRTVREVLKQAFIRAAAEKIAPHHRITYFLRALWQFNRYVSGKSEQMPESLKEVLARVGFLTDTSAAIGPWWGKAERVFPQPGGTFVPEREQVAALLPQGYEQKWIKVNFEGQEVDVCLIESHETRAAGDEVPRYDGQDCEAFMQAVRSHPSLERGKAYDVVVVVEVSAADLRKAAQADRTSKGVTTRRQKVTAAEHTGLAVSAVGTMLANLAGIIVSVLSR